MQPAINTILNNFFISIFLISIMVRF